MPYGEQGQTQEHRSSTQSSNQGARHHTGGDQSNIAADKANYQRAVRDLQRSPSVKERITSGIDDFRQADINRFVKSTKKKNLNKALNYGLIDRLRGRGVDDDEVDYFDIGDIKTTASRFGGDLTKSQISGLAGLRKDLEFQDKYDRPTQTQFEDYYGLNQPTDTGGGGEGGGEIPWWLRQQAPVASIDDTTTASTASTGLGGGHFQVPLEYVVGQQRAAEGGIIGSVGGTSRQKYQMGNMVEGEMEGAEMEGADRKSVV